MSFRFARRQGMAVYAMGHAALRLATTGNSPFVPVTIAKIAGEDILAGQLVSMDDSAPTGTPNAWLAEADGAPHRQHPVGYALNSAVTGAVVNIIIAGEATVLDAFWDAIPAAANVGDNVFMSLTKGNSSITAPVLSSSVNQKVSIVSRGGAALEKVIVQIGDGVLIG